MESYIFVFVQF